jgi:hypothetical protein
MIEIGLFLTIAFVKNVKIDICGANCHLSDGLESPIRATRFRRQGLPAILSSSPASTPEIEEKCSRKRSLPRIHPAINMIVATLFATDR